MRYGSFENRTMHKIKCSDCGADAEVPFQPKEGRPVYCRDCYSKKRTRY
ncbi:DNA-directed RNA polymerase [Candidatus Woesearchaeota archaeon]|nr:DNA-directed RNA polymerase [Candidatus Woesearchaeota archaeon]